MARPNDEDGRALRRNDDLDLDRSREEADADVGASWPGKRPATRALARRDVDAPVEAPRRGRLGRSVAADLGAAGRRPDPEADRRRDADRVRAALSSVATGGQPLRPDLASSFSRQLGVDLSDVLIYANGPASAAAHDLGAQAFTAGSRIVFAPGRFAPDSPEGRYVLAHELVHVAQQKIAGAELAAARMEIGPSESPLEQEAERGSAALLRGAAFTVEHHASFPAISMFQGGGGQPDAGGTGGGSGGGQGAPAPAGTGGGAPGAAPQGQGSGTGGTGGGTGGGSQGAPAPAGGGTGNAAPAGQGGAPSPAGQGGAPAPAGQGGAPAPAGQGGAPAPAGQGGGAQPGAAGTGGGAPGAAPQGQGGGTGGGAPGAAPQGQGGGTGGATGGTGGGAPGAAPSTAPGGANSTASADVDAELEKRADPAVKSKWQSTLTQIDTFRIQSLQFSYNPTSIGHNLWQSLIPTDNIIDHWRLAFTNNPYGAGDDPADKWQAGLEGLRGVVRLVGDLAGAVANWTGILSGISAALALITSETVIGGLGFGAIAVILGNISTIANAFKVMTDLLDMLIGVIQMIILAQRIKKAPKGSPERARLLMLMKKESADFTQATINAVGDIVATAISAMTMGLGSGAGAAAGDGIKAGVKAGVEEAAKLVNPIGAIGEAAGGLSKEALETAGKESSVVAKIGAQIADLVAQKGAKGLSAEAKIILQLQIDAILLSADPITKGGIDYIVNVPRLLFANKKAVAGAVTGFAGGSLYAVSTGRGKSASSMTDTGSGPGATPSTDDPHQSISNLHVSVWPSLLPPISDMRGRLQNAKIRMQRQFNLARDEVSDPAKLKIMDDAIAKLEKQRADAKATAAQQKNDATADANTSQQQVDKANQGKSTQDQLKSKADDTKSQAQSAAQNPAMNAKPTGIMAWIGGKLGDLQNWLLTKMLSGSDVSPEEASAAGIAVQCLDGHHNDQQAASSAADAEANADELTKAVQKVRTGKDASMDYATQSMADAQHWMDQLGDLDESLGAFEAAAPAAIERARQQIIHERQLQGSQQKIDASMVQPIVDGATTFGARIATKATDLHASATAAAGQGLGLLAAKTNADLSQPTQACATLIDQDVATQQKWVTAATAQVPAATQMANALVGTTNYAGVPALAGNLEKMIDSFNTTSDQIQKDLGDKLSAIINSAAQSLADQAKAAAAAKANANPQGAPGAAPQGQGGTTGGAPGANPGGTGGTSGGGAATGGGQGANPQGGTTGGAPSANPQGAPGAGQGQGAAPQDAGTGGTGTTGGTPGANPQGGAAGTGGGTGGGGQGAPAPAGAGSGTGGTPGAPPVQRKADGDVSPGARDSLAAAASSSGAALPGDLRGRLEGALGADLSGVRIHISSASAQAAGAVGARAYATGQDVHFGAGRFDPASPDGEHLIAHEVAHTVQQRGAAGAPQHKLEVSEPGDALEREADAFADRFVAGSTAGVSIGAAAGSVVHRDGDPKGTWNPIKFYEADGLVPASDHYQASNNLKMVVLTLSPLVKGGIAMASVMTNQANAKMASLTSEGPLTQQEATDLTNLNTAAVMAYRGGINQMKQTLSDSLSKYKEPEGFSEAADEVQEMLHEAFTHDESLLGKAQQASEAIHTAAENMHHLIEMAETARQQVTMIDQWMVEPAENSFDSILEKGGEFLRIANVIHASVQAVWACATAISANMDSSKSTAQKGAAGIEAGNALVGAGLAVGTFIGIAGAASMGLIWADLVGPQTQACLKALEHLDDVASKGARQNVAEWWHEQAQNGGGPPTIPKEYLAAGWFPGGQETLNYMWAVYQGAPPDQAPASVVKFFYDNRKKLNEGGGGSEMETEWHAFSANEVKNLKEWVVGHKDEVWGMLYGALPHPGAG